MRDGERGELKGYGGFWHSLMTAALKGVLWIAYICLKFRFRGQSDQVVDQSHIETIPEKPIPSVQLAFALDPKSPAEKLIGLVDHESYVIRRALARNPSLPSEYRDILRTDKDPKVSEEVERLFPSSEIE